MLSDEPARALLTAPQGESLKARWDRAILATLAYHGIRREELCKLKVREISSGRTGCCSFALKGRRRRCGMCR